MMANCSGDGSDDEPVSVSFKQLKRDKLALSTHLKADYVTARKNFLRKRGFRDPRFDPRVNGECVLADWKELQQERDHNMKKLKKQLMKVKTEDQRERIKKAIKLLQQREATDRDVALKRRVKHDLQKEQMENLKAGKRASFLTRHQLKDKVKEERLKTLKQRDKEKYLSRQAKKKYSANPFDN